MYSSSLEMALFVGWELVGTSFLPHKDGLFEDSRDDSVRQIDTITLVRGLAGCVPIMSGNCLGDRRDLAAALAFRDPHASDPAAGSKFRLTLLDSL